MFDSDAPEISDLETLDLPDGMVLIWAVVKLDECQPDIKVIIPVSREILGDAELIDEIIPEMLFDAARAYLAEMTDGQIDNESTRPRTLPMHDNCPLSTL